MEADDLAISLAEDSGNIHLPCAANTDTKSCGVETSDLEDGETRDLKHLVTLPLPVESNTCKVSYYALLQTDDDYTSDDLASSDDENVTHSLQKMNL